MKSLLITAGGTWESLDPVRVLGNRSTGSTGLALAQLAHARGWQVELLLAQGATHAGPWPFPVKRFETHHDLMGLLATSLTQNPPDALVHAAAVGDYTPAGWYRGAIGAIEPLDGAQAGGKVPSGMDDLWIRLRPLPKILDKVRTDWNFQGCLVSFKLEEGGDPVARARDNLVRSGSDLVVANTWSHHETEAFLVFADPHTPAQKIERPSLALRLLTWMEAWPGRMITDPARGPAT